MSQSTDTITETATSIPQQRTPIDLYGVYELLELAQGYLADGVAGQAAAEMIGQRDDQPIPVLDLLRQHGRSRLSGAERLAQVLDAAKANLAALGVGR